MTEIPLLGFAIPAYRRPANLNLALESLVQQARRHACPIYIVDDSCDETNRAVVARWKSSYDNIVHEINESNLGIDRNINKAITQCPAQYVHVIGDDDVVGDGFADEAVSIIRAASPSHIVCSYHYLSNLYVPLAGHAVVPKQTMPLSLRRFLPEYGWTMGFIGAHIFNTAKFASGQLDGFGTYFHHIVRMIGYLDPDEAIGFIEHPYVGNRADDESTATWSGDRLKVVFGIEQAFRDAMQGRYLNAEILNTIAASREHLGYTQFYRLLYWGALAERSGDGAKYWSTLETLVSQELFRSIRSFPRVLYTPLLKSIPWVRRTKRYLRGLGM